MDIIVLRMEIISRPVEKSGGGIRRALPSQDGRG
jgi:hypothetical protein